MTEKKVHKLAIIARPKNGFRRAGFAFSPDKATIIDTADLSEDTIKQLKAEPNLVVTEVGNEAAPVDTANVEAQAADLVAAKEELTKVTEEKEKLNGDLTQAEKDLKEAKDELKKAKTELTKAQGELKKANAKLDKTDEK